ncbi:MAG: hypothetical protein RMA76_41105 [Deltaproteobacteria bacterium]
MSVPATRTRALVYAGVAVVLFSVTLLVSRLADFGVVPAEEFGAGDWKRGDVKLQIDVVSADGIRHPLPSTPELRPGDRLHLAYGKTRYTSLWVVRIGADRKVRPLVPAPGTPEALGKYGRRTENAGEALDLTIEVPDEEACCSECSRRCRGASTRSRRRRTRWRAMIRRPSLARSTSRVGASCTSSRFDAPDQGAGVCSWSVRKYARIPASAKPCTRT